MIVYPFIDGHLRLNFATFVPRGGGCLLQEKIVASCGSRFVLLADASKKSAVLGTNWRKGIPIDVIPSAYVPIMAKLKTLGGTPVLREGLPAKFGPAVTDNGLSPRRSCSLFVPLTHVIILLKHTSTGCHLLIRMYQSSSTQP